VTFNDAWMMERRIRMVHKRVRLSEDSWYCYLCSNHGDIQWPCRTIQALENRDPGWMEER
jgi:hypothetical protein